LFPQANLYRAFFSKVDTYLSLAYSKLPTVPPKVSNLTDLVEVDLSHNFLTELSPMLNELKALKKLTIRENRLTSLPDWFFTRFAHETVLDISGNRFTQFPQAVGTWHFDSLLLFSSSSSYHLSTRILQQSGPV